MAPKGDWRTHATFVAELIKPATPTDALVIFSLQKSNEELLDALLTTKRLRWDRPLRFPMTTDVNYPVVYRLIEEFDLEMADVVHECYMFRMDAEKALKSEYSCPANTKLSQLTASHAATVNEVWPHKTEDSINYISAMLERNDSVGLFLEDTGELVSWAFVNFVGALASLQTAEAHKRKGYGTIVGKAVSAKMASWGWDPYGTVIVDNYASQKLFTSLGFRPQSQRATFFVTRNKTKTKSTRNMGNTDILSDIPLEELPQLIHLLNKRLGRADGTYMVNVIKNAIDWLTKFPDNTYVTVMAPNGDWRTHATFVADIKMPGTYALVIHSLQDSNEELQNSLLLTKRIDWSRPYLFAMVPALNYPAVYRVVEELDLILSEDNPPCYMLRIDKEDALQFDSKSPAGTKITDLNTSHADTVDDVWPHKSDGSNDYIAAMIDRNDSVGLFMTDTDELVSWAFVNFVGALASLQTAEAHQRKGYGSIVTKAISAKMAAQGWDPYGTALVINNASQKLFTKLGFERQTHQATFFVTFGKRKEK